MPVWKRCGNTPFYRKEMTPEHSWRYADPFNFTSIETAPDKDGETVAVLFRKAPKYDPDAAAAGVDRVSERPLDQVEVLAALHEWAKDLSAKRDAGAGFREIKKLFEDGDDGSRTLVLDGILALASGSDMLEIPGRVAKSLLVVKSGTEAEDRVKDLEEPHSEGAWIKPDLGKGVEEAVAKFGVLEC